MGGTPSVTQRDAGTDESNPVRQFTFTPWPKPAELAHRWTFILFLPWSGATTLPHLTDGAQSHTPTWLVSSELVQRGRVWYRVQSQKLLSPGFGWTGTEQELHETEEVQKLSACDGLERMCGEEMKKYLGFAVKYTLSHMCWCTPAILVLGILRQEDCKFEAILSYFLMNSESAWAT